MDRCTGIFVKLFVALDKNCTMPIEIASMSLFSSEKSLMKLIVVAAKHIYFIYLRTNVYLTRFFIMA